MNNNYFSRKTKVFAGISLCAINLALVSPAMATVTTVNWATFTRDEGVNSPSGTGATYDAHDGWGNPIGDANGRLTFDVNYTSGIANYSPARWYKYADGTRNNHWEGQYRADNDYTGTTSFNGSYDWTYTGDDPNAEQGMPVVVSWGAPYYEFDVTNINSHNGSLYLTVGSMFNGQPFSFQLIDQNDEAIDLSQLTIADTFRNVEVGGKPTLSWDEFTMTATLTVDGSGEVIDNEKCEYNCLYSIFDLSAYYDQISRMHATYIPAAYDANYHDKSGLFDGWGWTLGANDQLVAQADPDSIEVPLPGTALLMGLGGFLMMGLRRAKAV